MTLGENVVSALVGALIAAITSLVGYWASYKNLRSEYLAKRNIDLSNKQVAACESLWKILEPASRSQGDIRVIVYKDERPYVILSAAKSFYESLYNVFYSVSGLYFSRQLRDELFDLTDFIKDEFISLATERQTEIQTSNKKARRFDGKVQQLRIAIRAEIGVEDLKVASEEPMNKL